MHRALAAAIVVVFLLASALTAHAVKIERGQRGQRMNCSLTLSIAGPTRLHDVMIAEKIIEYVEASEDILRAVSLPTFEGDAEICLVVPFLRVERVVREIKALIPDTASREVKIRQGDRFR